MYDLTYNSGYRCLYELDVNQLMQKHWRQKEMVKATTKDGPSFISSQPSWQKESTPDDEKETVLEPGTAVLDVCFIRNPHQPCTEDSDAGLHRVLFGSQSGSGIK